MTPKHAQRASPSASALFVPAAEGPSSPLSKVCTKTLRRALKDAFATPRAARRPGADASTASARQRRSSAREGDHVGWPKTVAPNPRTTPCSLSSGPGLWLGHLTTEQRPLALPAPAPVRFQPERCPLSTGTGVRNGWNAHVRKAQDRRAGPARSPLRARAVESQAPQEPPHPEDLAHQLHRRYRAVQL